MMMDILKNLFLKIKKKEEKKEHRQLETYMKTLHQCFSVTTRLSREKHVQYDLIKNSVYCTTIVTTKRLIWKLPRTFVTAQDSMS